MRLKSRRYESCSAFQNGPWQSAEQANTPLGRAQPVEVAEETPLSSQLHTKLYMNGICSPTKNRRNSNQINKRGKAGDLSNTKRQDSCWERTPQSLDGSSKKGQSMSNRKTQEKRINLCKKTILTLPTISNTFKELTLRSSLSKLFLLSKRYPNFHTFVIWTLLSSTSLIIEMKCTNFSQCFNVRSSRTSICSRRAAAS